MAKLSGGGIQSNKNVNVGVRTGSPRKGSSPGSADQIGQTVAFRKDQVDAGRGYNASQLGNAKALDVGKGGPGTGRTVHKCGSQNQWGAPNRGESQRGAPRGFDTQGRGKDVV
jgi:hypothetical protein